MVSDRPNESTRFERRGLPDSPVSSSIPTLKTTKAPGFVSPELSSERVFVTITLVEAGGLEPPSKKESTEASTSVSYTLIVGPSVSCRRDTSAPVR